MPSIVECDEQSATSPAWREQMQPAQKDALSNGLKWAVAMFGLDLVEWLVMLEILLHDQPLTRLPRGWGFLELYFVVSTISFLLQLVGIVLVKMGWNRTGGITQIVACVVHLPKGEGLIGLIGGIKACRYAKAVTPAVSPGVA